MRQRLLRLCDFARTLGCPRTAASASTLRFSADARLLACGCVCSRSATSRGRSPARHGRICFSVTNSHGRLAARGRQRPFQLCGLLRLNCRSHAALSASVLHANPSNSRSAPSLFTLSHVRLIQAFSFLLKLTPFRAPELSTNSTMGPGVQFNGAAPGPPSFFNPLYEAARDPPSESISWKGVQTFSATNVRPV